LTFDGRASPMDVTGRWRQFRDDQRFRSLFDDIELFQLSEEIFGSIKDVDVLRP
jgi:hypothetical protein